MAKRSQRRAVRYERDQAGCMWGLINMFDFRHGRSTQKLIADRRRGSRHAAALASSKNNFDKLAHIDVNCQATTDGEENPAKAADAGKPSVKKLIEEEMFNEQGTKKEKKNSEVEPKESNSEHGVHKKKNRRKTNRSRSKSCDGHIEDLNVTEIVESERSSSKNKRRQSTKSLDMDEIMEEFCRQIHQRSTNCIEHDQKSEVQNQPKLKNPNLEEKLSEAIKLFINQKLINGKNAGEDGYQPSKELRDALQVLNSDEELFLRLLQDPKSVMVKHVQNLQNAHVEKDEDSKSVLASDMLEQELLDSRQPEEVIHHKQHRFFRKRSKSLEKHPSKENKSSDASNRIVILKPGPAVTQNSETVSTSGALTESKSITGNKGSNDRVGSYFSLTEIKRKWKHAMGKEREDISSDGTSNKISNKNQAKENSDRGFRENAGRNSPSKDHFFIEKVARPSMGVKKGKRTSKLKESEISMERESANNSQQRVSNIYIEARKHLSEMLSNGAEDMDFPSRQIPKTLGRILSLSDYSHSPIDSPRREWGQNFVTAQMRFSSNEDFQKQENSVSHLGQTNIEAHTLVSDDTSSNKAEIPLNPNSSVPNNVSCDNEVEIIDQKNEVEITICLHQDDTHLEEDDVTIKKSSETVVEEDSNMLDVHLEPSNSFSARDDQDGDGSEVCDEKQYYECMKLDSNQGNQPESSPLSSPSSSFDSKKVEDLDCASEIPERQSPVSVLEPIFTEEDVSPASIRTLPVELPIQPVRIQFEDPDASSTDQHIHLKTGTGDWEPIAEFVKVVLQVSGMKWDAIYMRLHSTTELVDPSICNEVEFFPNQLCCDKKLLFDGINEVLMEVCGRYLVCYPGLTFIKHTVRPVPSMKNAISEVSEGVHWNLFPLPLPSTLDHLVEKDLSKTGAWMDLQFDAETIIVDIGYAIFEDLMEEIIISCTDDSSEGRKPSVLTAPKESETSIDL